MPNALRAILWLFLMLSAMRGMAQNTCDFKLSGTVIDADNGKGLAYANVFLEEPGRGVATDSLGNFAISGLCEGVYNAKVSHIGCNPLKIKVSIPGDNPLIVEMTHDDHVLDAFEVVDERHHSEHLSHMVAKSAEIQSRSGLQMAEQAALIPGVSTLNTGNNISKPVFRGLHSNRLIVLNNGIRQEGQYWGSEHSPEIDAYVASEYEVVEGADALRYASDGIAGILLVHPPDVFKHDSLRGSLQSSLSTNGRGGSVSAELSGKVLKSLPLYFRVQGTAKKLGWIKTSDDFLRNTGIEELNGSYALGWKGNTWRAEVFYSNFNQKIGLYRYSHLGNLSDLAEVLNGRPQPDTLDFSYDIERPFQEISHELFKAKLEVDLPGNEQVGFVYARQYNGRSEYDIHAGFNTPVSVPQLDYGLTTHLGEATWKHRIGGLEGTFGASGILRRNNFRGRGFMPNYKNRNVGIFLTERQQLESWEMKYGARYDWYSADIFGPVGSVENPFSLSFQGLAAAVNARKEIENGDIGFSLGTQWRAPAVNEQFSQGLHHGVSAIEQGNPDLDSERSYNASATLRKSYNRSRVFVSAYANVMENFIYPKATDVELTIRGSFPRFDYEQTDALYWGADFQYHSDFGRKWRTMLRASLVWASDLNSGDYFINIPAHNFEGSLKYVFDDWKRVSRPFIGLGANYTMRQYRSPAAFPFESVFNQSESTVLPSSFDFAPAPDDYFLLSAEAGLSLKRLNINLRIDNILNTAYRNYMNRFRYYADEPGINFTLRLNYTF